MLEPTRVLPADRADLHRPRYHFLPPANWLNDPNGLIQWRGRYHLFYQHNPHAPTHGQIHWGHAVSDDLVRWAHLPMALTPTPGGPDENGCWSGCAVVDDAGRPVLVYTGLSSAGQRPCLAYGDDDLLTWEKYAGNPVIPAPPAGMQTLGFRDHSVWREDGWWYQVIGSGTLERGGTALLYRSRDLLEWDYLHPLTDGQEHARFDLPTGQIWECPDIFPLGDRHILLISVWNQSILCYSAAFVGRYANLRFTPDSLAKLDHGDRHFYAPQTLLDNAGRRLMWGWIGEGRSREAQIEAGWSGVMSLPRVLTLRDGKLRQSFAPELRALRGPITGASGVVLAAGEEMALPVVDGRAVEIELILRTSEAGQVGLRVLQSPGGEEHTDIAVDWRARQLVVTREASSAHGEADRSTQIAPLPDDMQDALALRVYIDHSVIEIIANEEVALTTRVYPTRADSARLSLYAVDYPAHVERVAAWELASIW